MRSFREISDSGKLIDSRIRNSFWRQIIPLLFVYAFATPGAADTLKLSSSPQWTNCPPSFGTDFQCASFKVPLDYREPKGQWIELPVVRLPASDPARRIGSLLLNPGGPGASAIEFLTSVGIVLYSDEVRARYDLVALEPRGVARGAPLLCFDSLDDARAVTPAGAFPLTLEAARATAALDRKLASACRQRGWAIQAHMSTANAARDLEQFRRAVGEPRLNFVGISYGSHLGLTYANLFPETAGAMVLDGVVDPVAWSTGYGKSGRTTPVTARLGSEAASQEALREFLRRCDLAPADFCPLKGGAKARFDALAARLRQGPMVTDDPINGQGIYRYENLIEQVWSGLFDYFSWVPLAFEIKAMEDAANATAPATTSIRAPLDAAAASALPPDPAYINDVEAYPAVMCSETLNPRGHQAWWKTGVLADQRSGYFGSIWTWSSSPCAVWTATDKDRYLGPYNRRTRQPILLVSNRYDPATPYAGAVRTSRLQRNSRLLTLDSPGHTSLFLSQCIDAAISGYLLTGVPPAAGTVCRPDVEPFGLEADVSAGVFAQVDGKPSRHEARRRTMEKMRRWNPAARHRG